MFNKIHRKRLLFLLGFAVLALAVSSLVLFALKKNINLFYTPTELKQAQVTDKLLLRVGGMVARGSVRYLDDQRDRTHIHIQFTVHDTQTAIKVNYSGVLPDLFREGQGVVVQGYWRQGEMQAIQVLAKHDENYMPPEMRSYTKMRAQT